MADHLYDFIPGLAPATKRELDELREQVERNSLKPELKGALIAAAAAVLSAMIAVGGDLAVQYQKAGIAHEQLQARERQARTNAGVPALTSPTSAAVAPTIQTTTLP